MQHSGFLLAHLSLLAETTTTCGQRDEDKRGVAHTTTRYTGELLGVGMKHSS